MSQATQQQNIAAVFPSTWSGDTAKTPQGGLYTLQNAIAAAQALNEAQINYTRLQTRIASATDSNLDQIASDMLGPGSNRTLIYQGGNLVTETDPIYSTRIRATLIAEQATVKGIQSQVNSWLNTYYIVDYVLNVRILGADTAGGLDTWGGLDGRPSSAPTIPTCTVFDLQSDPHRASLVGLTAGQFCVLLTYGGLIHDGVFLGRAHGGRNDHLLNSKLRSVPPLSTAFDIFVRKIKAAGTVPIYYDNRG